MKSCADCASCVPAAEVPVVLKKNAEADVCFEYGHILSRPGTPPAENERIKIAFAETCPGYGAPRKPDRPLHIAAQVAFGDPDIMVKMSTMVVADEDKPTTCTGCQHFVPPNHVKNELGWTLGMCAAKGRLLFSNRYVDEAANCGTSLAGPARDTTDGVTLLPQYNGGPSTISMTPRGTAPVLDNGRHSVDPREYPTDREVTPAEAAAHIRAWRRVDDPEGLHDPIFMPIYNGFELCGFDPRTSYGDHRPDLYTDHAQLLYDFAVELIELDETPILIGGAGTGKTECTCWLAYLMDVPHTRISVKKGTEDYHLAGQNELVTDIDTGTPITVWKDGQLSRAYPLPGVIDIDEPNLKADVFEFIRPATDSAKQLVLDNGKKVPRGAATFLILTQNPADDPLYVGTEPVSAADMDRISPFFFDLPTENVERAIITKHCADQGYDIPAIILDKVMQIADDLRAMISDGTLPIAWGLRAQIKVAKKTRYYSLEKAYRRALVDGLEQAVVDDVLGVVRGVA